MSPAPTPITDTTQNFLETKEIKDDLVMLKNGSCAQVIQVGAINFSLLSEKEQEAMIYAYASLLNSLAFPIQILIKSQKKDISTYVELISKQEERLTNPQLKQHLANYKRFIRQTIRVNKVLDKKFYVIIPFSYTELGVASSGKNKQRLPLPLDQIISKAKTNLEPRKQHLIKQLARLGLKARVLTTQELVKLMHQLYNPEAEGQKVTKPRLYQSNLVTSKQTKAKHD